MNDNYEKLYRDQFAHYLNISPGSEVPDWAIEGYGLESLSISYNPQVEQYKTILQRSSDAEFEGNQPQSSVSDKRIYKGDKIYEFLNKARRKGEAITTDFLEVEMAEGTENSFPATKYKCLIVITEFLGEGATIAYDIYLRGNPIPGRVTITDSKPTFSEEANLD